MEQERAAGWDFSCPDWKERLLQGRSLMPALPLDRDMASRAVQIFNMLRLPDVIGQPSLAETAGDWQREIPAAVFGSLLPNGRRMVRKVFQLVPKKNNKTTGGAAIMVTALLIDPAPRQPYFMYGPSQEIAHGAFDQAAGMIAADPVLRDRFLIKAHVKTIVDRLTESTLKIQTFDEGVATGAKPKGALIDEIHILGKRHYAQRVMGQLWGGMVSRPDSFLIEITTQSDQAPAGLFAAELDLARGIRDGRITGAAANTLPLLYEFPEEFQTDPEQPWRDPACWPQVLPNLGRSIHLDLLKETYAEASEKGAEEERRWASQHLNIQIGMGLHAQRWAGADYWLENAEAGLTLDELLRRCEVVVVGIDGGGLGDLFGFAVVGRERGTDRWLCWAQAWALPVVLERHKSVASRLRDFAEQGDLHMVSSAQEIVSAVVEALVQIRASGLLPTDMAIGVDAADMGTLVDGLAAADFRAHETDKETGKLIRLGHIEPVKQGVGLTSAIHTAEFKLHDGLLVHGGSEMMAWCVSNAKAVQKGNSVAIDKEVAGSAKIDPLIALFCAVKLMELGPVAGQIDGPSVYEDRGLLVL